jgi:hypothetical protein
VKRQRGFTFVEIAIIAPIVILAVGAFITVIVGMTGEVLTSRTSTQLLYNVQDALNRIDQDVKLSSAFIAESNVTLTSPQGYNDDTTVFDNVDSTKGTMLVLNTLATTGNPLDASSSIAYLNNSPNACGSLQGQNTPMSLNVVYFIKNNTLWRRTIMPANYATAGCNNTGTGTAAPWQQPSCTAISGFCKTLDERLVDGVSTSGFTVQYFNGGGTTTENVAASANPSCNTTACVATRNSAMTSATTISATIDAHQTVAGKDIEQVASIRSTRLDTNASVIASPVAPSIPSIPVVTGSAPNINQTTGSSTNVPQALYKWSPSTGGGTITYTLQYRINGGSWNTVNNIANSGTPSYAVPGTSFGNVVDVQVKATNSAGASAWSATSTITVPLWAVPQFQNGWLNYGVTGGGGYSGQPYDTVGFSRSSSGLVSLKGLVKSGSTYPNAIFTLPVGYRPSETQMFSVIAGSDSAPGRVDVFADGTVTLDAGTNGYVSLDTVRFMPAPPAGPTFTPFTPATGWVFYGSPYAAPGYYVDSAGRVNVKGLIKSGSTTIWTFPTSPSLAPAEISYNASVGGDNGFAEYNLQPSGNSNALSYNAGSNAFFTLQSIFYPAGAATWTNLTLQNSWVAYSSPYTVAAVTKGSDGIVSIKGFMRSGITTNNTIIATLPVGYRPKQEMIVEGISTDRLARLDIYPNGSIALVYAYANTWLSIDNINFPAEQ